MPKGIGWDDPRPIAVPSGEEGDAAAVGAGPDQQNGDNGAVREDQAALASLERQQARRKKKYSSSKKPSSSRSSPNRSSRSKKAAASAAAPSSPNRSSKSKKGVPAAPATTAAYDWVDPGDGQAAAREQAPPSPGKHPTSITVKRSATVETAASSPPKSPGSPRRERSARGAHGAHEHAHHGSPKRSERKQKQQQQSSPSAPSDRKSRNYGAGMAGMGPSSRGIPSPAKSSSSNLNTTVTSTAAVVAMPLARGQINDTSDTQSPNSSLDIWTENDPNRDVEGFEVDPRGTVTRSSPRQSSRKGSSGGRGGRGKGKGGRGRGRAGKDDDTVSICGTDVNKRHLIGAVVLCILIAGGTVAALLVTGALGGSDSKNSSEGSDAFAPLTVSPTSAPGSADGGPLEEGAEGTTVPLVPTPRPTLYPTAEPTISPKPTITPEPTSCTESTELFKYFGTNDEVITSSCKKLTLSVEAVEDKCRRTIVFGGGDTVRDYCPVLCLACAGAPTTSYPTDRPTLEPSPRPSPRPTRRPSQPASGFAGHDTFSFYVMGDIPYMYKEELTLIEQLQDQQNGLSNDDAVFQVHVGDIQNPQRSQCESTRYDKIAGYFTDYTDLPTLMLPGDNDWNDCPNPDLAWGHWTRKFVPFENNWAGKSPFPSTVERQAVQPENFAFTRAGVLFLGLNLVGGRTNEYVTEEEWALRIDRDILWATTHLSRYNVGLGGLDPSDPDYIRAVIVFGHSPRARRFNNFIKDRMGGTGIPTLYMHGNGHTYLIEQPFADEGMMNFWQVQVDQGANAPPVKVTVRGTTAEAQGLNMAVDGGRVFDGFIKVDRRGGLYPGVELAQP